MACPLRERGEREPVPRRDHLVVEGGLRPPLANLEQPRPRPLVELAAQDRAAVLERLQQLRRRPLLRRPRVREPLHPVGVRVLRRGEPTAREPQLTKHVVERLLRDGAVPVLAGDQPGVKVRRDEKRVVVEHLLEVRHEPAVVDRVAVEAAADDVVHPAGGHRVEREAHGLESAAPQEEFERRGGREFRRMAEAAPAGVELGEEDALGLGEQRLGERLARRLGLGRPP